MDNKSTILIVDDNLAGRETLKGLLYGRGYELVFAANGIDALKVADEATPDLILLDVMMPGMDGFEVCQRLRANPKVAEVPVIMVTALDDRESRLRGIEAGADDFVSKPFDHAELRKRVETITRLNRYRRLVSERTKFEWVVDHADDGYLILNQNDQISYANSQARLYLNLPGDKSSYPTTPFLELVQTIYHCEPYTAWAVWPSQPSAEIPRYMVRPASTTSAPFWMRVDVVAMNSGEFLVRLIDVSPKVAEQRSMWSFHGQVSHKLRTPLNHLFASLDMINEEDLVSAEPDIQTFFTIAKQGATRLKNEIQDIFQYIEVSDVMSRNEHKCKLARIEKIIKRIATDLMLDSVKIEYALSNLDQDQEIILSERAIELILWELLENAKKFHPKQSPDILVTIVEGQDSMVVITVIDNGINLAPSQLEKMWVPYYQAERYFTGQVKGTGLGLSLITSIVWGVGGSCTAYNRNQKPGIAIELKIPY
jgi:DNA-binding response OmpR family regulator